MSDDVEDDYKDLVRGVKRTLDACKACVAEVKEQFDTYVDQSERTRIRLQPVVYSRLSLESFQTRPLTQPGEAWYELDVPTPKPGSLEALIDLALLQRFYSFKAAISLRKLHDRLVELDHRRRSAERLFHPDQKLTEEGKRHPKVIQYYVLAGNADVPKMDENRDYMYNTVIAMKAKEQNADARVDELRKLKDAASFVQRRWREKSKSTEQRKWNTAMAQLCCNGLEEAITYCFHEFFRMTELLTPISLVRLEFHDNHIVSNDLCKTTRGQIYKPSMMQVFLHPSKVEQMKALIEQANTSIRAMRSWKTELSLVRNTWTPQVGDEELKSHMDHLLEHYKRYEGWAELEFWLLMMKTQVKCSELHEEELFSYGFTYDKFSKLQAHMKAALLRRKYLRFQKSMLVKRRVRMIRRSNHAKVIVNVTRWQRLRRMLIANVHIVNRWPRFACMLVDLRAFKRRIARCIRYLYTNDSLRWERVVDGAMDKDFRFQHWCEVFGCLSRKLLLRMVHKFQSWAQRLVQKSKRSFELHVQWNRMAKLLIFLNMPLDETKKRLEETQKLLEEKKKRREEKKKRLEEQQNIVNRWPRFACMLVRRAQRIDECYLCLTFTHFIIECCAKLCEKCRDDLRLNPKNICLICYKDIPPVHGQ